MRCQPTVEYQGRVPDWVADIKRVRQDGDAILFVANSSGRAERTIELLKEYDLFAVPADRAADAQYAAVLVVTGGLPRGFRLPDGGLQLYAEADVFAEERRTERRQSAAKAFLSDLRDLGWATSSSTSIWHWRLRRPQADRRRPRSRFGGRRRAGVHRASLPGEDKLFVPVERLDLIQKYTGASRPPIDRLGGATWERREDPGQEGHARHGRRTTQAVRAAQGGSGLRVRFRLALAT